jgi:hypothetical protein
VLLKLLTRKKSRPILRADRKPRKSSNHSRPGYIYVFYDPIAKLSKIGLSRTPKTRRYYLSKEYNSELQIVASAYVLNMAWGENKLHKKYNSLRHYRTPKADGFTEWFRISSPGDRLKLKLSLIWSAFCVNFCYVFCAFGVLQILWKLFVS